jgi:signal transduction histidine kinase
MLSDVAARFAHEIRNPLGSIALFASSIGDDPDVRPEIKALAEYISTSVDSINAIIENLIIAVKPGESPDCKIIDLRETLEDSLLFAGHLLAANKSVCIKTHWDAVPLRVWGDAQLLKQVMLNLILNAIQAMPEGGEISITCRRITEEDFDRRLAEIRVSDTGVGIAEADLVRVFDPYFTTKDDGTGLGMAIVHNIISAHHGVIDIVSEHQRGAECIIHLPLATEGGVERLAQPMTGLRTRNAEGQRS